MGRFKKEREHALPFEELLHQLRQAADREGQVGDAFRYADVINLEAWRAARKSARRLQTRHRTEPRK